jgi:hypothetical protein
LPIAIYHDWWMDYAWTLQNTTARYSSAPLRLCISTHQSVTATLGCETANHAGHARLRALFLQRWRHSLQVPRRGRSSGPPFQLCKQRENKFPAASAINQRRRTVSFLHLFSSLFFFFRDFWDGKNTRQINALSVFFVRIN